MSIINAIRVQANHQSMIGISECADFDQIDELVYVVKLVNFVKMKEIKSILFDFSNNYYDDGHF